jgi:predicted nucleotidyltransferase
MDGRPILVTLARLLDEHGLEAILIGNAAAALQGAPVTTVDLDFFFRKTPGNLAKLKSIARTLEATIWKPSYPLSGILRVARDRDLLQVDFLPAIHGVRSFASLRSRARRIDFDGHALWVADLRDIIKSKREAGRPQDEAVLEALEEALREREKKKADESGKARSPEAGER